jgi:glycosyl transferase family 87
MDRKPILIVFFLLQIVLYTAAARTVQPKESDFPAFYSAARIWASGQNPYDLEVQCSVQEPIRGVPCLPFAHPPVLLPLISLVSNDDFTSSYYRWLLVLVLVTALCILPLYRLCAEWKLSVQTILFFPIVVAITFGQDTPFILLGVLLWIWLLTSKREVLAGLVLSIAVLKPQIAILLAVPLLFSRPKAFAGFLLGAAVLSVYSFALVGVEGFRGALRIVEVMSQGHGYGVNPQSMQNATALLVRSGLSAVWSWPVFALGIIAISIYWKKNGISLRELSAGIIVALFTAPHLHFHDLSLLTPGLLLVHPLVAMLCSIVLLSTYAFALQQWSGYAVMLALLIFHLKPLPALQNKLNLTHSADASS